MTDQEDRIEARLTEALAEVGRLAADNARLRELLGLDDRRGDGHATAWTPTLFSTATAAAPLDASCPTEAKLALLWSLFGARSDVFARPLGEPFDREVGVVPSSGRRLVEAADEQGLPAVDRRRPRPPSPRRGHDRDLPTATRRPVHAAGLRLRRWVLGARCARLPRRLPYPRGTGSVGALPVGKRGPRVDLLRRRSPRRDRPVTRHVAASRGHDDPSRARSGQLRPVLPVPGLHAERCVRQPHRLAPARQEPRTRRDGVPGPDHDGTLAGPVGVSVLGRPSHPGRRCVIGELAPTDRCWARHHPGRPCASGRTSDAFDRFELASAPRSPSNDPGSSPVRRRV